MIKFMVEEICDVSEDWTDDQISNHLLFWGQRGVGPLVWCDYDEQLFDNPYINKHYVEKPGPAPGYRRIRYAREQHRYPGWPYNRSKEDMEDYVRSRCWRGPSYIWCYGDEELFKEGK